MGVFHIHSKETAVIICHKDRPTELDMLLESLYFQTYQDFDIFILDDMSGTPLQNYHHFNCIINLMKRTHKVFLKRTHFPFGVSRARQEIIDWAMKGDYKYFLRVDDDVVLEADFVEKLNNLVKSERFDIASGVTPPMGQPTFIRDPKHLGKIINRVILDENGEYILNSDDCGMGYTDSVILPAHHFRSSALMTRAVHEKIKYYPTKLTKHGFREEQIFSYMAQMEGFKIGVDTSAIAWHQMTPSGGERFSDSNELIKQNQKILIEFTKEHKDKLNELFTHEDMPTDLELKKESNLLMK